MLSLTAPITMSADQQTLWLASAVDALQDIRGDEVAAVSAEIRRTVTRPSQIVPEIARLVAERRNRPANRQQGTCGCGKGQAGRVRDDVHWVRKDGELTIEYCP
jgi:hypothetical protein